LAALVSKAGSSVAIHLGTDGSKSSMGPRKQKSPGVINA